MENNLMKTQPFLICSILSLYMCPIGSSQRDTSRLLLQTNVAVSAGDYRTVASSSWNSPQTWERFDGTTWAVPLSPPDSGSGRITVRSGDTVTITAMTTYDQLTVESGGQVTVAPGVVHTLSDGPGDDLRIDGTWLNQGGIWTIVGGAKWVVNDGGTFIHNSSAAISTPLSKVTLSAGSNFVYRGSSSLAPSSSFSGRTYGNLTLECAQGQWSCTASGGSQLTVAGKLHIGNGVKWNTGGFSGIIVVQGVTVIDGEWSGSGSGNLAAHTFQGDFMIGSSGKYQLNTTGANQGNITVRGDFLNNGVFAGPANRLMLFDGINPQTIGGSAATSVNADLTANGNIIVAAGAVLQLGAGRSMTVHSDIELFGALTGSDSKTAIVLAGSGNRLVLHDASLSLVNIVAKDGRKHSITGQGVCAGCNVRADSGSLILLDTHLTLVDGNLDASGGEITLTPSSTIFYRGSSARPICPLQYSNLSVEGNPGAFLVGPTTVYGILSLNTCTLSTGANALILGPDAVLQEVGSASVIGKVTTTRLPRRGIRESFGNIGLEILPSTEAVDSITVSRQSGTALVIRGASAITTYFDLSSHGKQLQASLTLQYTSRDLNDRTEADLRLLRSNDGGVSWSDEGVRANLSERTFSYSGPVSDSKWTAAEMLPLPSLTGVTPSSGSPGDCLTVVLIGTGFEAGVNGIAFSGLGISTTSITVNSPVQCSVGISIDFGATRGMRDVSVTTSTGTAILKNAFEVTKPPNPAPTLARIVPSFGTRGKNTSVSLSGDGLLDETTFVSFGDSIVVRGTRASGGSMVVDIAIAVGANPGLRNVTVSNPSPGGGSATLRSAFLVANPVPVVTTVYPTEGTCSQARSVVLQGSDFIAGVSMVNFGEGIDVDSVIVLSSTRLEASIRVSATALVGFRDISVVNIGPGGGTAFLLGSFRVTLPVPKIISMTPPFGLRGASTRVFVAGSDFLPGISSLRLGDDIAVDSLVVVSSGQMSGILRIACIARAGPRVATIINSGPGGGSSSRPNAFEIHNPVPCVTSVRPLASVLGRTTEVVLSGSGLFDGACSVDFGAGIAAQSVAYDSNGAGMRASVMVSRSAVASAHTITVTNTEPGGGTMAFPDSFIVENPKPNILNVNPSSCAKGRSAMVRIVGSEFLPGRTSVSFAPGILVDTIIVDNDTSMNAHIVVDSNAAFGARWIVVTNSPPGGGNAVLPHVFNVESLAPRVTRVMPEIARGGERLSVLIEGMNFAADVTKVDFGEGLSVDSIVVISPSQLRVLVLVPEAAAIGARTVSVFNPPPGGGAAYLPNGFMIISRVASTVGADGQIIPKNFDLLDPYPNPFNPSIRIRFLLPERSIVLLTAYNTLGVMVARVLDEVHQIGVHEVTWSADNLPSGVYFVRMVAEATESTKRYTSSRKVILVK
jgi:hypothetical protein